MNHKDILEKAVAQANDQQQLFFFALDHYEHPQDAYRLIFDHDFAKAIWGDGFVMQSDGMAPTENWQVHLQQMVIADDPIQYLGDNLA